MGLFSRRKEPTPEPSGDSDRLATLSRRIDDMESAVRRLSSEWVDTLDRFNRLASRVAKRAERDVQAEEAPEPPPPVNGATSDAAALVALRRKRGAYPTQGR